MKKVSLIVLFTLLMGLHLYAQHLVILPKSKKNTNKSIEQESSSEIKPSDEILNTNIICGIVQTGATLDDFEQMLKDGGNIIKYEIYNNGEIIMVSSRYDNLHKKSFISRFQFKFLQKGNDKSLLLNGGIVNDEEISVHDIRLYLIGPIESKKQNEWQEMNEKMRKEELIKISGSYTGIFTNDDDISDKNRLEIKLYTEEPSNIIGFDGILKFDDDEFDIIWTFYNDLVEIEYSNIGHRHSKSSTRYSFEIKGEIDNNVFSGTANIEMLKRDFMGKTNSEKKGTFHLIKLEK